ncbi:MAG: hypothetical protein U1F56_16360 [Rubrivivax sp.]
MNDNTATIGNEPAPSARARPARGHHDRLLLAVLVALVALAAWVGRAGWFQAGDDVGYTLGLVGGVLMLVLLLYPARKYLRVMRNAGRVKGWFWMHMVFGIAGPWLILVHSTFRIGSLNAGVALISMLVVVASGVVGRFLFVRVQQRLEGGQASLDERRRQLGLADDEARSMFAFAPDLLQRLQAYEAAVLPASPGAAAMTLPRLLAVPLRDALEQRRCHALLRRHLAERAAAEQWPADLQRQRGARARRALRRYFDAVLQVAHYTLFDRLFALWHVAHLPFVVLLAVSAIVHVVAVHAY